MYTVFNLSRYSFALLFCFSLAYGQALHKALEDTSYATAQEADEQKKALYKEVVQELDEISYQKRKAKADAGDIDEQVTLAQILERAGRLEEATYYYRMAADQGDVDAQQALISLQPDTQVESTSTLSIIAKVLVGSVLLGSLAALGAFVYKHHKLHRLLKASPHDKDV